MLTLNKLTQYTPEYLDMMIPALYLQTEDGLDWYYHLTRFQADTMKICFDDNGVIRSFHADASRLFPSGLSVVEVNISDVPDGLNIYGEWLFKDGKIVPVPVDYIAEAEKKRDSLMDVATARITALTEAQEDNDITPEEEQELTALRTYRSALRRIDLNAAPDIDWPNNPTA